MPEDLRVERVARAMAKARRGYEEYPPSLAAAGQVKMGGTGMSYSGVPEWEKCLPDAKAFVAAFDALTTN